MNLVLFFQQAGGTIIMDADATAALRNKGVDTTNDSFKFTWFQVCLQNLYFLGLLHLKFKFYTVGQVSLVCHLLAAFNWPSVPLPDVPKF